MENEVAIDEKHSVVYYYPESTQEALIEESESLTQSSADLKNEVNEGCSNIVSIVDGSVVVTRYQ